MKILTINYLSHSRPEYFNLSKNILKNISDENKSKIHLNILYSRDYDWDSAIEDLGISTSLYKIDENRYDNYLCKINIATEASTKYSCKLDEDCFISDHTWNFIIENIGILDSEFLISPTLSNNIPCDFFINDFIKEESVKDSIFNLFLKQEMPNGLWGVDYSPLNSFTILADKWDYKLFNQAVLDLDTKTKGIHPLRINYDAQVLINDYIINNIELLFNKQEYSFSSFESSFPYFTNSFFFIKTSDWKNSLKLIDNDSYDEISLNNFIRENNKKIIFVKNGFGVHIMFNTVYGNKNRWGIGGEDGWTYEKNFCKILKEKYDTLHRG
jgi:hypothetical protein